jgi:hypothetical protein
MGVGFIEVRTEYFWESITSDGFASRQRFYPWPGIDISSSLCQSCSASDKVNAMLPCVHEGPCAKLRPAGAVQDHMCWPRHGNSSAGCKYIWQQFRQRFRQRFRAGQIGSLLRLSSTTPLCPTRSLPNWIYKRFYSSCKDKNKRKTCRIARCLAAKTMQASTVSRQAPPS